MSDLARVASDPVDDTMKDESIPPVVPREAFGSVASFGKTVEVSMYDRAMQLVPGTMVGEYEVTGVIGSGGMGSVYAAIHPRIGKQAAIKVLQRELASDPAALVRFENEAKAVNEIKHPNIVDIFAFGELPNGNPYFVMERVEGESLQSWLDRRGRLGLDEAMPILHQIFDALAAAHDRGIIHRDLKPGNIMIAGPDTAPRVTILDFGLAKMLRAKKDQNRPAVDSDLELTVPGMALGTPLFMSPEQFLGESVDLRTDVYALGVIIYVMLCGRYPFRGETPQLIGMQHVVDPPPIPSSVAGGLPIGVDEVLMKALAKEPTERYTNVRELRDALTGCSELGIAPTKPVAGFPRAATPYPSPEATSPVERAPRHRVALLSIVVGVAIALAVVIFIALREKPEPAAAPVQATPPTVQLTPVASEPPATSPAPAPATAPSPAPAPPPVTEPTPPVAEPTSPSPTEGPTRRSRPKQPPKAPPKHQPPKQPCDPYKSLDGC